MSEVELLKAARTLLIRGRYIYICYALAAVADANVEYSNAFMELEHVIYHRLGRFAHLDDWLRARGYDTREHPKKLKATRIAWVNALITEYGGTP